MGIDSMWMGPVRPWQRDRKADWSAASGLASVRSAVGQILGTVGASEYTRGELPWRPELGSLLRVLVHQKNDAVLQDLGRVYVVDALKKWEPRVRVTDVDVSQEELDGRNVLSIRLVYDVVVPTSEGTALFTDVEQSVAV